MCTLVLMGVVACVSGTYQSIGLSLVSWLGECVCGGLCLNGGCFVGVTVCMNICAPCVYLCMLMFVCVRVGVYQVSVPVLPQARRGDRWSWDPDEERKRQERWQQKTLKRFL